MCLQAKRVGATQLLNILAGNVGDGISSMMRILKMRILIRILKMRILRILRILIAALCTFCFAISIPLAFVIREGGERGGLNKPRNW